MNKYPARYEKEMGKAQENGKTIHSGGSQPGGQRTWQSERIASYVFMRNIFAIKNELEPNAPAVDSHSVLYLCYCVLWPSLLIQFTTASSSPPRRSSVSVLLPYLPTSETILLVLSCSNQLKLCVYVQILVLPCEWEMNVNEMWGIRATRAVWRGI